MLPTLSHGVCTLCTSCSENALCKACMELFIPLHNSSKKLCTCGAAIYGEHSLCLACQQQAPCFHTASVGYRYSFPLNKLLIHYKHLRRHTVEASIKQLWLQHVTNIACVPDVLVPIPLHRRRYWRRGFNQAERLARLAAAELALPCVSLLKKHQSTSSQQGRTRSERQHNLKGSFSGNKKTVYRHIALVDDVITTGSTANEAAKTLLELGAHRVDIWALARAF